MWFATCLPLLSETVAVKTYSGGASSRRIVGAFLRKGSIGSLFFESFQARAMLSG